MVVRFTKTKAI